MGIFRAAAAGRVAEVPAFAPPSPEPALETIELEAPWLFNVSVSEMLSSGVADGAALVHADPPWSYSNNGRRLQGVAASVYDVLDFPAIVADLNHAFDAAAPDAYLLLWCTYPKLFEWRDASLAGLKWRYVSGGTWAKDNGLGVGFHWRGDSEPLLLYVKGKPKPQHRSIRNTFVGGRSRHSEKPEPYLRTLVAGFSPPRSLVVDLYAGLAPLALACRAEGRNYVGAEIDAERHAEATARLEG